MRKILIAVFGLGVTFSPRLAGAKPCESLARMALPYTKITTATLVAPGDFKMDAGQLDGPPQMLASLRNLPGFCRVTAEISPVTDSDIRIEVWMPAAGWNGKFEAVGNGGWSGAIPYPSMAAVLHNGYATAGTDTGHEGRGDDASFALGHPEKVIDSGYRAVHEMTVKAKAIIASFYDKPAARAYWNGCSTGGKQGLMEAQRFPADYDGIVAGAPANYWTHLMAGGVSLGQATHATPASYIPPGKYPLLHKAALDACDAGDGVRDGVIDDPTLCRFDPGVLLCKSGEQADCLTAPQIEAARKIYAGPKNPRTGQQVFPGLEAGSELNWDVMAGSPEPPIVASFFKYLIFKNPSWDFRTLNVDRDVARADELESRTLNATDPDLSAFVSHGGKLLLYHGWSDGLIAPRNTVNYYTSVVNRLGATKAEASVRLFMIPGMMHCGGGDGTDRFDALAALDEWKRTGKAPDQMPAIHTRNSTADRSRPICAFPRVARYTGHGSTNDAANFVCTDAQSRR